MNVGNIISKFRKQAGLSQGQLAEACEISQSYLSQIEKNRREPHMTTLKKLSEVLEVPLPVLLFLSVDEEDIPEQKRDAFKILFPSIKAFLVELFPKSEEVLEH